jgi:hypothetical protein
MIFDVVYVIDSHRNLGAGFPAGKGRDEFHYELTITINEVTVRTDRISARTIYSGGWDCPPPTDWYHLRDEITTTIVTLSKETSKSPTGYDTAQLIGAGQMDGPAGADIFVRRSTEDRAIPGHVVPASNIPSEVPAGQARRSPAQAGTVTKPA